MLSEVLAALATAPQNSRVIEYLEGLSRSRRFSALTLFMTTEDKTSECSMFSYYHCLYLNPQNPHYYFLILKANFSKAII